MITFADNFLAGSLITLLLPALLLTGLAVWYHLALRHIPQETPESSATIPSPEVVAAAGPDVHEVTPMGETTPGDRATPGDQTAPDSPNAPGGQTPPRRRD